MYHQLSVEIIPLGWQFNALGWAGLFQEGRLGGEIPRVLVRERRLNTSGVRERSPGKVRTLIVTNRQELSTLDQGELLLIAGFLGEA